MIQTDERSGLRHSVSLNHGESQPIPEGFGLLRERGSARDERPEFPAETRVDPAESPPPAKKVLPVRQGEILAKLLSISVAFLLALDLTLEGFNEARDRDKNGDPLSPDRVQELR